MNFQSETFYLLLLTGQLLHLWFCSLTCSSSSVTPAGIITMLRLLIPLVQTASDLAFITSLSEDAHRRPSAYFTAHSQQCAYADFASHYISQVNKLNVSLNHTITLNVMFHLIKVWSYERNSDDKWPADIQHMPSNLKINVSRSHLLKEKIKVQLAKFSPETSTKITTCLENTWKFQTMQIIYAMQRSQFADVKRKQLEAWTNQNMEKLVRSAQPTGQTRVKYLLGSLENSLANHPVLER